MRDVSVEFHFDFGSPNAYLSHKVIPDVEARTGVSFTYVPVLLGGVFKATGNQSPVMAFAGIRNKPEYERLEMMRFIERHGLTQAFAMNPHFPVNTLAIMRGAVAAQHLDVFKPYVNAIYAAMWQGAQKMDDPETIGRVLAAADLPADALMAKAQVVVAVEFPEQQQPMCRLLMCKCCICCAAPMARGHMKQGTRLMVIA